MEVEYEFGTDGSIEIIEITEIARSIGGTHFHPMGQP